MARRGSFSRMFEGMIEFMGRDKLARMAIIFNPPGSDYILATEEEATKLIRLDTDGEMRVVMAMTYEELAMVLSTRPSGFFDKDRDVN